MQHLIHGRELDVVRLDEVEVADLQPPQALPHARLRGSEEHGWRLDPPLSAGAAWLSVCASTLLTVSRAVSQLLACCLQMLARVPALTRAALKSNASCPYRPTLVATTI